MYDYISTTTSKSMKTALQELIGRHYTNLNIHKFLLKYVQTPRVSQFRGFDTALWQLHINSEFTYVYLIIDSFV